MSANLKVGLIALFLLACFMGAGVFVVVRGFKGYRELDKVGVETQGLAKAKGYRKIGGDFVPLNVARTRTYGTRHQRVKATREARKYSDFVVSYSYEVNGEVYQKSHNFPLSVLDEHNWRDHNEVPVIVKYHPEKPNLSRIAGFAEEK